MVGVIYTFTVFQVLHKHDEAMRMVDDKIIERGPTCLEIIIHDKDIMYEYNIMCLAGRVTIKGHPDQSNNATEYKKLPLKPSPRHPHVNTQIELECTCSVPEVYVQCRANVGSISFAK